MPSVEMLIKFKVARVEQSIPPFWREERWGYNIYQNEQKQFFGLDPSPTPLTSRQKWTHRRTILEENQSTIILWHIIPYNLCFKIFSEKMFGSNSETYCPIQPCKIFEQKPKTLKIGHLIPFSQGQNFFSIKAI